MNLDQLTLEQVAALEQSRSDQWVAAAVELVQAYLDTGNAPELQRIIRTVSAGDVSTFRQLDETSQMLIANLAVIGMSVVVQTIAAKRLQTGVDHAG